ncbi:MAG: hypothetical protein GC178_09365 [Flavobacteriales bacterium]|nr:hypothetical protein [Flavobacteriales bacterium]
MKYLLVTAILLCVTVILSCSSKKLILCGNAISLKIESQLARINVSTQSERDICIVSGSVREKHVTGHPDIGFATILMINQSTKREYSAFLDLNNEFNMTIIPYPDTSKFELIVEAMGLTTLVAEGIRIQKGQEVHLEIVLGECNHQDTSFFKIIENNLVTKKE